MMGAGTDEYRIFHVILFYLFYFLGSENWGGSHSPYSAIFCPSTPHGSPKMRPSKAFQGLPKVPQSAPKRWSGGGH